MFMQTHLLIYLGHAVKVVNFFSLWIYFKSLVADIFYQIQDACSDSTCYIKNIFLLKIS